MPEEWTKNRRVHRLDLDKDKDDVATIEYALERVIAQPRGAGVGNHAMLIVAMKEVFNVNLNKRDSVEAALWCLWREDDNQNIESDDTYIAELKEERKQDEQWADEADSESENKE
jgi:hypothetical protein